MKESMDKFEYILSGLRSVDRFPFNDAKLVIISAPVSVFKDNTICLVFKCKSGTLNFLDFVGAAKF